MSVSRADAEKVGVKHLPRFETIDDGGRPVFADRPTLDVSSVIWATGYRPDYGWMAGLPGGGLPLTAAVGR